MFVMDLQYVNKDHSSVAPFTLTQFMHFVCDILVIKFPQDGILFG